MRIAIREQLVLFVTLNVLIGLAVVALPTWFFVHRFVVNVSSKSLALTASIKASKIAADLDLVRNNCRTISSRILIQTGLHKWYVSRISDAWGDATRDLEIALDSRSQTGLLQARIYTRDGSGNPDGIVNVTGRGIDRIRLPYDLPDGSPAYLGGDNDGDKIDTNAYPSSLYPNITYDSLGRKNGENNLTEFAAFASGNISLTDSGGVLLGPLSINESYALISVTLPIQDYDEPSFILGYLTVLAAAQSLIENTISREGLGDTGLVLLLGPDNAENRFNETTKSVISSGSADEEFLDHVGIHYVLPPRSLSNHADRHQDTAYDVRNRRVFPASDYPAALRALEDPPNTPNKAGSMLSTNNENGANVAVGYARTNTTLADWTVLVEQSLEEAYRPITTLSKILLACVFGTAGAIFVTTYMWAHMSVQPIRRLKAATEKTVAPPGYEDWYFGSHSPSGDGATPGSGTRSSQRSQRSIKGWLGTVLARVGIRQTPVPGPPRASAESESRPFKIPGKVVDRKRHFITDELTELTKTYNDMSDELQRQYTVLDDKVAERTRELEVSKKAAEAANESKTLFIANISHELKTPLNGILGMCAVLFKEKDVDTIQQSLRTLYKSGDLLLHLLEDLLSFSKNQIGQQLALEQKEFGLADIRSQILTIFDKQARESGVHLSVVFLHADSVPATAQDSPDTEPKIAAIGPQGTGRLKDMRLYGDQHRILQVIINLVSNSLKFTPSGGRVEVRIKCLGETEAARDASRSSSASKGSNAKRKRLDSTSTRTSSRDMQGGPPVGTALTINPMEPKVTPPVCPRGRSPTPPPAGARSFEFEFVVEDTGPGIPEEMKQQVFEPFVQGDWGLSRKFGGTGLGLSICQQLAGLMGGSITLRSTMGVGSVFTMQIPLKYVKDRTPSTSSSIQSYKLEGGDPEPQPTADPDADTTAVLDRRPRLVGLRQPFFTARPNGCPRARVLVAEDNPTNVEVVSRMLRQEAVHDVTVAKDGQEAYEQVQAAMAAGAGFSVIFMDVQMPNVDGLQSTRLIRGMGYKRPIVALTALEKESNIRQKCLESGMDEFLPKPIRREQLKRMLLRFTIEEEDERLEGTTPSEEAEVVLGEGTIPGEDRPAPV